MRIQEMKSGMAHLRKTRTPERPLDNELRLVGGQEFAPEMESIDLPIAEHSEIDQPIWSIVSFKQLEAGGLTYKQASEILRELNDVGVSGLCIITDEAAARRHR